MTNRLELTWKLDGFVDEQRYYCSETPIDVNAPPAPVAVLAGDVRSHTESGLTEGKRYYTRISAFKNGVEKISDEKVILFGQEWTPSGIAKLWIDAEHVVVNESNQISLATDMSISGFNLSQANNANKPILANNVFGDKPAIRFNGSTSTGQWLASTAANVLTASKNSLWCFVVVKNNSVVVGKNMGIMRAPIGNGDDRGRFTCLSSEGSNLGNVFIGFRRLDADSVLTYLGENISSNKKILCFERNYTTAISSISVDGVKTSSIASGTTGNTSNTTSHTVPFVVGTESVVTNYLNGDIACLIFGNNELSLQERQKLEGWAAHKYGLTGNLPSDHPYKILVPTI